MAQRYTFPQSGVSSISVDGIEHKIDPETGELVVDVLTTNLAKELEQRGAKIVDPDANKRQPAGVLLTDTEQQERQDLFAEIDAMTGTRLDRRRSLQQLRELKADLLAEAARSQGRPPEGGEPTKAP